jgi:hypothetical protein
MLVKAFVFSSYGHCLGLGFCLGLGAEAGPLELAAAAAYDLR